MSSILVAIVLAAALALLSRLGRRGLGNPDAPQQAAPEYATSDPNELAPVEAMGDTLDLHGAAPGEIGALVDAFIEASRQHGWRWVRIVHGKGTGTLRRTVRAHLAQRADVIGFADAPPPSGWGATVVEIDVAHGQP